MISVQGLFRLLLIMLTLTAYSAHAADTGFPEKQQFAGQELVLNGKGVRSKLLFKLYTAGLYLPDRNTDAQAILQANQPMALRMEITSSMITSETMQEAVSDGFKLSAGDKLASLQDRINQLTRIFSTKISQGDVYDFVYRPQNLLVIKNGQQAGTIAGADFKQAFYAIWLGDRPVQADLKSKLLGQ